MPVPPPVPPIGGRYQATREERSAPQARLVRAKDLQADAEVSVWLVRAALPPDRLAHFGVEADRAHRVIFDGLRPVLDHGVDQGRAFVVVPALNGETLGQAMRARRPPARAEALEVIRELAQSLTHAHRHGLVHGYLRPDDVFLTEGGRVLDGVGLWPALGMLGVAELFGADAHFLAPEVRAGTPPSTRADVYGLAMIGAMLLGVPHDSPHLVECLAERPAERAASPLAVSTALARAVRGEQVDDERGTQPHVRADMHEVMTFHPRPTGSPVRVATPADSITPPPVDVPAARGTPHQGIPLSPSLLRPITQLPPARGTMPPIVEATPVPGPAPGPSMKLIVLAMITVGIVVGAVTVIAGSLATDRAVEGMRQELRAQLRADLKEELADIIHTPQPAPPSAPAPAPASASVSSPPDATAPATPDPSPAPAVITPAPAAAGCPKSTVRVPGRPVCIDRTEATGPSGAPRVQITHRDARTACATRGMTLCSADDWEAACRGTGGASYPYGSAFLPGACNVETGTVGTPGAHGDCRSASGALDMAGNVAEWIAEGGIRGGSALRTHDGRCSRPERRPADGLAEDVGYRCCVATE